MSTVQPQQHCAALKFGDPGPCAVLFDPRGQRLVGAGKVASVLGQQAAVEVVVHRARDQLLKCPLSVGPQGERFELLQVHGPRYAARRAAVEFGNGPAPGPTPGARSHLRDSRCCALRAADPQQAPSGFGWTHCGASAPRLSPNRRPQSLPIAAQGYTEAASVPLRPTARLGIRACLTLLVFAVSLFAATPANPANPPAESVAQREDPLIKIGVLAVKGIELTRKMYTPTAVYLGQSVPGYRFEIIPITLPQTPGIVERGDIDFLVTQGAGYATVEYEHGVTRIATMRKRGPGDQAFSEFAGVIIVAADSDIQTLEDLPGRSFMAVGETAFGGRWMAERELNAAGITFEDFSRVEFSGFPQQGVARAVLSAQVDAGTLRTGMLEGMIAAGEIKREDFRILGAVTTEGFSYLHSTRMYPEWAFAVLRHTDGELARQVAVALLNMPPDHPAAKQSKTKGWAVPMDYQRVHELMKALKVGPYVNFGAITLTELGRQYWHVMLGIVLSITGMGLGSLYVLRLNRRITESRKNMRLVLDNVRQGLVTIDRDNTMDETCSATFVQWLGAYTPGANFVEHLRATDSHAAEWFDASFTMALDGILPLDIALAQLPKRMRIDAKTIQLSYTPIVRGGSLHKLLIILSDVSAEAERERAQEEQREVVSIFERIAKNKTAWLEFFADSDRAVADIAESRVQNLTTLKRLIHTLKGNTALYGVTTISSACHTLEDWVEQHAVAPSSDTTADLKRHWARLQAHSRLFLGGEIATRVEITEQDYEAILRAVLSKEPRNKLARMISNWKLETTQVRLERVAENARALAKRLGKGEIEISIDSNGLRFDPKRWTSFWSAFVHIIRNAVDHGLESEQQRLDLGKSPAGTLELATFIKEGLFCIEISDDGQGIDWSAVARTAADAELPNDTHDALVDALFHDGLSTRDAVSETSGRGVGMGAVREACEERGGRVSIASARGKGTTMRFSFPRSAMTGTPSARAA